MKIVLNIVLVCVAAVLAWMCYLSILTPIQFKDEVTKREDKIIQRLKDIRTLQEAHRDMYGTYIGSWDELIKYVKTDSVSVCDKMGELTDEQRKAGLNEVDAWKYLNNPKKYEKELKKIDAADPTHKLSKETFRRDTTKYLVLSYYAKNVTAHIENWIDSIAYVPYAVQDTFELNLGTIQTASGYEMALFEAKVKYETYLGDLNKGKVQNKIQEKTDMDRFPGLQVGDASTANNNAGNWE